jgi:hypothetical protein
MRNYEMVITSSEYFVELTLYESKRIKNYMKFNCFLAKANYNVIKEIKLSRNRSR